MGEVERREEAEERDGVGLCAESRKGEGVEAGGEGDGLFLSFCVRRDEPDDSVAAATAVNDSIARNCSSFLVIGSLISRSMPVSSSGSLSSVRSAAAIDCARRSVRLSVLSDLRCDG